MAYVIFQAAEPYGSITVQDSERLTRHLAELHTSMHTHECLPKFLSVRDVEAWTARFGLSVDREEISRALRLMPIEGCIPPGRRGQRWTIPKKALLQLMVAFLAQQCGNGARFPVRFDRVYLDAAEDLMHDPELASTIPPALKKAVKARMKAGKGWRSAPG
jgi:hypothetical protein